MEKDFIGYWFIVIYSFGVSYINREVGKGI